MLDEKFSMIENKYLKKGIDFSKESLRRTNSNCSWIEVVSLSEKDK